MLGWAGCLSQPHTAPRLNPVWQARERQAELRLGIEPAAAVVERWWAHIIAYVFKLDLHMVEEQPDLQNGYRVEQEARRNVERISKKQDGLWKELARSEIEGGMNETLTGSATPRMFQ